MDLNLIGIIATIVAAIWLYAMYWRRCWGGGWWEKNQGPWWAKQALLYMWLFVPLAAALWGVGVLWWKALILGALGTVMWNPGHAGLSLGRDPRDVDAYKHKPIAKYVGPIAALVAPPPLAPFCVTLLCLDYTVRTAIVAAVGAYLVDQWFWMLYAPAGLATGPLYAVGWAIYDRGWRPVFTQPPHRDDGHLFGEWLNGGVLVGLLVVVAAFVVHR